jgi:hypothetical protein
MPDDEDVYEDEPAPQRESKDLRLLRQKAEKADTLEPENARLKKELAFTKAGIPLDDPKTSYFVKGYEGDLTAEAIKAEAIKAGFLAAEDPPVPAEDVAAVTAVAEAAKGAALNPKVDRAALYAQANTPAEVIALASANGTMVAGEFD